MVAMEKVIVAGQQLFRRIENLVLIINCNKAENIIAAVDMAQEIRSESKQLFDSCIIDIN